MKTITADELDRLIDGPRPVRLVDVLPEESYQRVHLPGAESIPAAQFESEAPKLLGEDEVIVVYCASLDCQAGAKAARKLERMGYREVYDFAGGIAEWRRAGYPLVRGRTSATA